MFSEVIFFFCSWNMLFSFYQKSHSSGEEEIDSSEREDAADGKNVEGIWNLVQYVTYRGIDI